MKRILLASLLAALTTLPLLSEEPATATVETETVAEMLTEEVQSAEKVSEEMLPEETLPEEVIPEETTQEVAAEVEMPEQDTLDTQMEDIKLSLVELKRDLFVLEEELLYPASSQVAVFLSMDVGEFFKLDSVTLKLNGKEISHYLYTERQIDALYRGGVQRLFIGNVKQGSNSVTAIFIGEGPNGREYKRAATAEFEKSFEPAFVELKISDSTAKYQPEFLVSVSS